MCTAFAFSLPATLLAVVCRLSLHQPQFHVHLSYTHAVDQTLLQTSNVVWKKNRNQHARLLLAQLRAQVRLDNSW